MSDLLYRVKTALIALGYNMDQHKCKVNTDAHAINYTVLLDGKYFGIWDDVRRTFID